MKRLLAATLFLTFVAATQTFAETTDETTAAKTTASLFGAESVEGVQLDDAAARQRALGKKKAGKVKVFIGLGIALGGGAGVMATASEDCLDGKSCSGSDSAKMKAGTGLAIVGASVMAWGIADWMGANADLRSLEASAAPRANNSAFIKLTDKQAVSLALGKRTTANYRLSW